MSMILLLSCALLGSDQAPSRAGPAPNADLETYQAMEAKAGREHLINQGAAVLSGPSLSAPTGVGPRPCGHLLLRHPHPDGLLSHPVGWHA